MVEINPLCIISHKDGKESLLAIDAKMSLDDNALYRHPEIQAMRDLAEEAPLEIEASKFSLNYIKLDGSIACLVNGAGLAMATMDTIKYAGGEPANFLDVGGGASPERVAKAFKLVLSDGHVKAILVNIFAGINRCDWVAEGVIKAVRDIGIKVPLVVRLAGTNESEGRRIIAQSGLPIISAQTLAEAAQKSVAAARGHDGRLMP
jgi:malate-CoA ligase subunit beta